MRDRVVLTWHLPFLILLGVGHALLHLVRYCRWSQEQHATVAKDLLLQITRCVGDLLKSLIQRVGGSRMGRDEEGRLQVWKVERWEKLD